MVVAGIVGFLYNRQLAATSHEFYIRLCVFAPLAVFGGLLMAIRPEWAGPYRPDSSRNQKVALFSVIGLMAVLSGTEFFHLKRASEVPVKYIHWTPQMGTPQGLTPRMPTIPVNMMTTPSAPEMTFLGQHYRLGSYNQKSNAMWEFVPAGQTVDNWQTMITVIDRPDARSRQDMDRLAQGIMDNYKSHGGRVLLAKTLQTSNGEPYNYMVVAFKQEEQQRYELNFVKIAMGPQNAMAVIYGARIGDPQDYAVKAKEFLDQNSSEIGKALESALPEVGKLPRRVF